MRPVCTGTRRAPQGRGPQRLGARILPIGSGPAKPEACLHSGGRWNVVADAAAMARGNDEYARAQRAAGAVGGEILSLEGSAVGDEAVLVRGRFARLRADGSRLEDATASYLVVKVVGAAAVEWKVAVCLAMG